MTGIPSLSRHHIKFPVRLYPTKTGRADTERGGEEQGTNTGAARSSHTAGARAFHSNPLSRQTQQILLPKKPTASPDTTGPLRILPAFAPQVVTVTDACCRSPSLQRPHGTQELQLALPAVHKHAPAWFLSPVSTTMWLWCNPATTVVHTVRAPVLPVSP